MLEYMLLMYVMGKPSKWQDYLHLVEFAYNNGQEETLNMIPFEALYGRKCRTALNWDGLVNRVILGPELLQEMEQEIVKIRKHLKATQDRQKIYVDLKRSHKEFNINDHIYLRLRSRKSSMKLGSCAKLAPRYYGPFEVLDRIGQLSYTIALPINMRAHNLFHVSLLKKYVHDHIHIIDWNVIQVEPEREFQVEPMHILNCRETTPQN